jgi:hypothetical protein
MISGTIRVSGGWVEVGTHDDPDRRRHWTCLREMTFGMGAPSVLFVTLEMARSLMTAGQWLKALRYDPRVRLPHNVIRQDTGDLTHPLEGLRAVEAETLAQLLGGRLPHEKELDHIVSTYADYRLSGKPWAA